MLAVLRHARPSCTACMTSSICASKSGLIHSARQAGKSDRCTDSGASATLPTTRFWYMDSVMKGMNGAQMPVSVVSTV